jgi:chaperonin cofactor prefoldin
MSKDITEKEAALISAAIAAYLAKPIYRGIGTREEAPNQLSGELKLLVSRVEKLEEKIDKLDKTLTDLTGELRSKRV